MVFITLNWGFMKPSPWILLKPGCCCWSCGCRCSGDVRWICSLSLHHAGEPGLWRHNQPPICGASTPSAGQQRYWRRSVCDLRGFPSCQHQQNFGLCPRAPETDLLPCSGVCSRTVVSSAWGYGWRGLCDLTRLLCDCRRASPAHRGRKQASRTQRPQNQQKHLQISF